MVVDTGAPFSPSPAPFRMKLLPSRLRAGFFASLASARRAGPLVVEALEQRIAPAAFTWVNPASGAWTTPANWSVVGSDADGIPDADDDVTINPAAVGVVVTISGSQAAKSITMPGDDTLQIGNASLTLSSASSVSNFTLVSGGTLNAGPQLTVTGTATLTGSVTVNGFLRNEGTLTFGE